jgi:hypothetical protein
MFNLVQFIGGQTKPTFHPTPQPATRNPQPTTRNPQPATRNPQLETRNPQPTTRNTQPATRLYKRRTVKLITNKKHSIS